MDKTSVQFNGAEVFKYFGHVIPDIISFDRFCEYLLSIRGEYKLRELLGQIFCEVGYIIDNSDSKYYTLPEAFYSEPWRGQNLVLDLLRSKVKTIQGIQEKVDYWKCIGLETYLADAKQYGVPVEYGELREELLAQANAEQNMDINKNLRALYNTLAAEMLNLEYGDSLLAYLDFINGKDKLQCFIAGILALAADICYPIEQLDKRAGFLPQVFYDEKWRVMRLVVDILVEKPKTKKAIETLIYCCGIEDPRYL